VKRSKRQIREGRSLMRETMCESAFRNFRRAIKMSDF
jgi:hypothetical protein